MKRYTQRKTKKLLQWAFRAEWVILKNEMRFEISIAKERSADAENVIRKANHALNKLNEERNKVKKARRELLTPKKFEPWFDGELIRPEADDNPIETVKIGVQVETPDGLGTVESVDQNEYNQTVYLVAHPKREPFPGIGGSVTRSFWTRGQMRVLSVKEKF